MKIYYKLRNEDLILESEEKDCSFKNYKKAIAVFLQQKLTNIPPNCMFIQQAMSALKKS